jgi:sugar lactone lactonase YvrE
MTYPFLARGTILTLAGTGSASYSGDGGASTLAAVNGPKGVVADGAGNVYVSDTGNNRVRKIDVATGYISTFAGTGTAGYLGDGAAATAARLSGPSSLAIDNDFLYISDTGNHCVRTVSLSTFIIDTYAGTGVAGYTGDGGLATGAQLSGQTGIMLDSNEKNLYIADTGNNCVRKIVLATGFISTVAGTGTAGYTGDGALATAANLSAPRGIGIRQSTKNLYIADTGNHCVRMVNYADGRISTIAGTGGTPGFTGNGGPATAALLNGPTRLLVTNTAVYVTDTGNHCVRMIDGGIITAFAGTGLAGFSGDRGPAGAATLSSPSEIFFTNKGNFIADTNNNRIRKILVY